MAPLPTPFPNGLVIPPAPSRDPLGFLGMDVDSYDPYTINPQIQQWSFAIQRHVPGGGVLQIEYAGPKGAHLCFGSDDMLGNRNKLDTSYWTLGRDKLYSMVDNPFYGVIT